MSPNRRDLLKFAAASAGASIIARVPEATMAAPAPRARAESSIAGGATESSSPAVTGLQSFLRSNASPTFSLPPAMSSPARISWAGPMSAWPVPTTLPSGIAYAASNSAFGGPIRNRFVPVVNGNPSIAGIPALAVNRTYSCKGVPRGVGSPNVMRFSTDAAVIELAGVILPNTPTSQTLIVDGQLVPPTVLSVSSGRPSGWDLVGLRIDFGNSAVRDIWLETGLYVAYVKLGPSDRLIAATDSSDPQLTVVGDSYLTKTSSTFANAGALGLEIGTRLGLRKVAVDAVVGSGYYNSGYGYGSLNDRVLAHAGDNSTIYLIMAGLNDYDDVASTTQTIWPTRAQYEEAVAGYFSALRTAQPNAVIVATAPFCPNATLSDSSYVSNAGTNTSGLGDFLYKSQVQLSALQAIPGPWVWIDVLMGGGWINSSGASGASTGLQWLTGGAAAPGTSAAFKPGNSSGASGGGFGGIAAIPIVSGGSYSQAPEVIATGGTGNGLLLASTINSSGALSAITVVAAGVGYTSGSGLPSIEIDSTFQQQAATLGNPVLMTGVNPEGDYPLPGFAPTGVPGGLSNGYVMLLPDLMHPSPAGIDYLASRIAQNIYEAVIAL